MDSPWIPMHCFSMDDPEEWDSMDICGFHMATEPPRQAAGPPRSGARVGVGMFGGVLGFPDLKMKKGLIRFQYLQKLPS